MYASVNPATGRVIEQFATITDEALEEKIRSAHRGYDTWRAREIPSRASILADIAQLLVDRSLQLSELVTTEMGKLTREAQGEIAIAADIFSYYATHAERLLADQEIDIRGGRAVVQKRPIGVILGIMPWNYPYYQMARFVAPNLALGNTVLLKHAPSCPRTATAIESLIHDAGLPAEAYANIFASHEQIERTLASPLIQGVSLTGSERAGSQVAAAAGRNLKKVVLELGGSDPMVILDADDLNEVIDIAAASRLSNAGQACNAPKRMIVMEDLYDEFVDGLSARMSDAVPGDPRDDATTLAPLSSEQALTTLEHQIEAAVSDGATLLIGGRRLDGPGSYLAPTILVDLPEQSQACREEFFGPVALVYRAGSENEAVRVANDTPYGLGASVFSSDPDRAMRVADQIEAGMIYINAPEGSQADLPFGGVKRSGFGRELGELGIEEFMNKKIVRLP